MSLRRCNLPGKPVFYCSGDPKATIFELDLNEGDYFVLSKWALKCPLILFPIGYTSTAFQKLNSDRSCPKVIPENVRHPNEFTKSNLEVKNFIDEKFSHFNSNLHFLTALISDWFLSRVGKCGVVYPTTRMHANAENLALTTKLVDEDLTLQTATWYRVDAIKNLDCTVSKLMIADEFSEDGEIHWRNLKSNETEPYL